MSWFIYMIILLKRRKPGSTVITQTDGLGSGVRSSGLLGLSILKSWIHFGWSRVKEQLYHNEGQFEGDEMLCRNQIFAIAENLEAAEIYRTTSSLPDRLRCCIERGGSYIERWLH